MANLPDTLQGMLQYVAYAEKQIKKNALSTKNLLEDVTELKPRIEIIKKQLEDKA